MLDLMGIYQNESVEDVLLHFSPRTPFLIIDRMYVTYKFDVVSSGKLLKTHQRLFNEGKLLKSGKPLPVKGPNWKEPAFVTEKNTVLNRQSKGRHRRPFLHLRNEGFEGQPYENVR